MKIRLRTQGSGEKDIQRVRKAVRAIESFRSDWFDEGDTTHKSAASTGVVIAKRRHKVYERHLRYVRITTESGEKYRPAVVDARDGLEEVLLLDDGGNVLYRAFNSDAPQNVGTEGLRQMARRLEWLLKQMQRRPTDCSIDGYSLQTPHRAN